MQDTVHDLKNSIQKKTGIPSAQQKLFYSSRELINQHLLE